MHKYEITSELFLIPQEDRYIVYSPLKRLAFLVSPGLVNLLRKIQLKDDLSGLDQKEIDSLKPLIELGIVNGKDKEILFHTPEEFIPDHVTLFLTTKCNMRCIYCYASGGEKENKILPLEAAKAAIDFIIRNTLLKKQDYFGISFHGGGEPTLAWEELKECVRYSKAKAFEKKLKITLNLATNGVIPTERLDWILENFSGMNISLDGPEDIQNHQRPLIGGKGGFREVMQTVRRMNERNFSYGIRATVTDKSVAYLDKIVNFFALNCRAKRIHFEPTFNCGRCLTSGIGSPSPESFIQNYRRAEEAANHAGISIFYSGARLDTITTNFCKAAGGSFCLTPDGDVTSCYEVCTRDDPRSETFFYGKYDGGKKEFIFSEEKLDYLRRRTVDNISFCKDCFCKYHCAGDCLAKASDGNDLMAIKNIIRCKINQSLTLDQIAKILRVETEDNS